MTWAVLDLETTTHSYMKRTASPFHPSNWVVMAGWATKQDPKPKGRRYLEDGQDKLADDIIALLKTPGLRFLVGQNIKFDLLYVLRDPSVLDAWMEYVSNGGNIWDLQLVEYVLHGQDQQSHMLSMDDMALRYDQDLKVDEVKLLWEAGVNTPDIDPALLSRYLLGEDLPDGRRREGDIGNTRDIFLKQLKAVTAKGMGKLVLLENGALIASIEMERNGMKVDKELGLKLAEELKVELDAAKAELDGYLPKALPFDFNWSNRYMLSPLIFGGVVNYEAREYDLKDGTTTLVAPTGADAAYAYASKDAVHYVLEDGTTMECADYDDTIEGLHLMDCKCTDGSPCVKHSKSSYPAERVTFKGGKNAGEYRTKKVKVDDYTKPKGRVVKVPWQFAGFTEPRVEWKSSTDGLWSVSGDVITELTEHTDIPFLKTLGKVAKLSKDLGTYFITTDEKGVQKGMLTVVGEDGLVHHSINHTSTVTGRLSGSNPNLQNIPKGNKSKAKQMFVSRFAGGKIGQSDFSSLEVYCQAWLTGAELLVQDLLKGLDLHCVRLAAKEGMPYEEVVKLAKGYVDADGKFVNSVEEWDYKRTGAKVFSFQRAYGAGNKTIADATGMKLEDVEAMAAAEDARYHETAEYFDALEGRINENAVALNTFVNHPLNPAVRVQLKISRITTPDGKRYTFRSHTSQKWQLKRGITSSFSPTERKNYPVQGLGGQVMKAAMWLLVMEFYRKKNFGGLALLINTVHDAAYRDAAPVVEFESAVLMHACMEAASDFMAYWFKWDIPLPVPSDSVSGDNMGEEDKLNSAEFKAAASEYRIDIRNRRMNGFTPSYKELK